MQPGITEYKIGIHRKGTPTQHEALVQAGEMDIQRFDLKTPTIQTYRPGQNETGADFGINIHRSSKERGVCVGPYSAGCQVFADGKDFETFMARLKASGQEKFLYALIENDELSGPSAPPAAGATGAGAPAAGEEKEDNTDVLKSTADKIREDLEKSDSNEENLIDWYNSSVNSKEDARKIAGIYQEKFKVNIFTDLKRALNDEEFAQLKHIF